MNKTTCSLVSGSVGALVVLTFVAGQPALAAQAHRGTAAKSAPGLANGSVTTAKLADNAVTSPKIAAGAVDGVKIHIGAVGTDQVANGSLRLDDVASATGVIDINFGSLPINSCQVSGSIDTGRLTGDAITLVSQPAGVAGNITLSARADASSSTSIDIVACNNGNSTFDPPTTSYRWMMLGNN